MNMNTTENNKLIAEFMGAKIKGNPILNEYEMYGIIQCIEDGENEQHHFVPQEMLFQSDWNWLMEVVEKIESLGYSVYISPSMVYINGNIGTIIHPIIIGGSLSKIEAVYNACVLFINHYNTQKL